MNKSVILSMEVRMKKKSYMNQDNLLTEGVIDQIIQWFKSGKERKAIDLAQKKHPGIKDDVKKINKLNRDIEQHFKDTFKKDIKLQCIS